MSEPADFFESIAGICKFIATQQLNEQFYKEQGIGNTNILIWKVKWE